MSTTQRGKEHGRLETRRLTMSTVLADYLDWPGQQQVFQIERERIHVKSGKVEREVVYGVTSLSAQRAGPERLLQLVRRHWLIENRSHWVRDVTYDEDRSQASP